MKPKIQAIVLADKVYQDMQSQKFIVCGIFNQLIVGKNIAQHMKKQDGKNVLLGGVVSGAPSIYLNVTEIHGGTRELELRFVRLSDSAVLFKSRPFQVKAASPLATFEKILPLPTLHNFGAGTFAFEIHYENEMIGSLRVLVEQRDFSQEQTEQQ